ncbi:MAG: hypothetical protein ACSNEK_01685 [Parachlamydiaceae bacterium]
MKINIRSRLMPFSHVPGNQFQLPFSYLAIQIFPTRIRLLSPKEEVLEELCLNIQGPVVQFTAIHNLEKGHIQVHLAIPSGIVRYTIFANEQHQPCIFISKLPSEKNFFSSNPKLLKQVSSLDVVASPKERLHLGMHKALEWELVKRRRDLKEILPVWHRLGQILPQQEMVKDHQSLFQRLEEAINQKQKESVYTDFLHLFLAGFNGIMSPRKRDLDYQGFNVPPVNQIAPLALLTKGSELIRSLFLDIKDNQIHLLPLLPNEIISGRLTHLESHLGSFNFEWSKRAPKKLIFKATANGSLSFIFPKKIHKARLRLNDNDKGVIVKSNSLLNCEEGTCYYLDQFAH